MTRLPSFRASWIAPAALAVALFSLAANGILLWKLRDPGRLVAPLVEEAAARLKASEASIKYQVRIPAGMPLHFDIPVDQTYTIRLNTTFPIDTRIRLPIRTPLGSTTVNVPVKANIPVRTNLPVRLRDTFRLRTETRAEYVVPLEIPLRDLPLEELSKALDP